MADQYTFDSQKYKNLKTSLRESPTAYARGVEPTRADLKTQLDLLGLEKERDLQMSQATRDSWYGSEDSPRFPSKDEDRAAGEGEGILMKTLNTLAMPLYGIVGGVEALTGTGSKKGLGNIMANIKERGTFGDILSRAGLPRGATLPLGFVLDVMFDPINWATFGTGALLPRIAIGAQKGGIKGIEAGIKSGILRKGAFFNKKLRPKAAQYNTWYDDLVGRSPSTVIEKGIKQTARMGAIADRIPKAWRYDPIGEVRGAFEAERARKTAGLGKSIYGDNEMDRLLKQGHSLAPDVNKMVSDGKEILYFGGPKSDFAEFVIDAKKAAKDPGAIIAKERANQWEKLINPGEGGRAADGEQLAKWLAQEAKDDGRIRGASEQLKIALSDETGWDVYDNFMKNIKASKPKIKKFLDGYSVYIGAFKTAKTGMSPGTWVTAIGGNTFFRGLAGLKPKLKAAERAFNSWKLARGKSTSKNLVKILNGPKMQEFIQGNPQEFAKVFGVNRAMLASQRGFNEEATRMAEAAMKRAGMVDEADRAKFLNDTLHEFDKARAEIQKGGVTAMQRGTQIVGIDEAGNIVREGTQMQTTGFSTEIFDRPWNRLLDRAQKSGAASDGVRKKAWNSLAWYMEKPMNFYETFDQGFKLGDFVTLVADGIDEDEIRMLARFVPIIEGDYAYNAADGLYRLSHNKAVEAVSKIYMNYRAMPAAARVFRSIPFVGAPFASFSYAMIGKTVETVVNNPAFFNKVTYGLQELSGSPSPLEKAALEEPYYERYKDPTMLKLNFLPFFQQNPIYLNLANMIPYYSMNIFQPSERRFDEPLADIVSQFNDRFPLFLKSPEGQVIFDYLVLPMLLKETEPVGMFNQPLYPSDANAMQKAGYAMRSVAEGPMPTAAGFLGLATPTAVAPVMPSYRWRSLAYAKEGKTPLGIQATEPAFQRTARQISAMFGFPLYPVKLEYISAKKKKELK